MQNEHKAGIAAFDYGQLEMKVMAIASNQLVCIEGNIGSGKTTLAGRLAEALRAKVFYEPVGENPYLERYYADPKRYALEMQFWLMSRRFEMHEEAIRHIWKTGQSVIMDRSIYGDWVFAKKNFIDGNIDEVGYESYLHHREVMNRYLLAPHTVLYLDVSPERCMARIKERNRGCEREIPLSYLQGLDDLHITLMKEMRTVGSKVHSIDWSDYGHVGSVINKMVAT